MSDNEKSINQKISLLEITENKLNWLISHKCKIEERNINIVFFEDYKNKQYKKPLFLKNFGFWLIGYDGEVKSFSLENKFLYEIFNLIDQMPIRQQEMLMYKTKC